MTRGTKEEHIRKLYSVFSKLENEGYRASTKKSKLYQKETIWLRHTISQDGIRPNKEKNRRNQQMGTPHKHKDMKMPSRCHTIFRKVHTQPSRENRQLLKKETKWDWTTDQNTDFNKIKQELTKLPCLVHYNGNIENIVTTNSSETGLGIAL